MKQNEYASYFPSPFNFTFFSPFRYKIDPTQRNDDALKNALAKIFTTQIF